MKVYVVIDDYTKVDGGNDLDVFVCTNKEAVAKKVKELYEKAKVDAKIDKLAKDNDWTKIGNTGWTCTIEDDYACVDNEYSWREFIYVKECEIIS